MTTSLSKEAVTMTNALVRRLILLPFVIIATVSVCVADEVPKLDVVSSCAAEAAVAPEGKRQCLSDEQAARETLVKRWEQFGAPDKRQCSEMATLGGTASYVELLTCLEMAADARKLPTNRR
jgi:hypothetical protein